MISCIQVMIQHLACKSRHCKEPQLYWFGLLACRPNVRQRCRSLLGIFRMHHEGFRVRLFGFHLPSEFVKAPSPVSSILFLLSLRYEAKMVVVVVIEFHIHDVCA